MSIRHTAVTHWLYTAPLPECGGDHYRISFNIFVVVKFKHHLDDV